MTITPYDIRSEYPEFSTLSDAQIQSVLNRATLEITSERWGDFQDEGTKLFAAHTLLVRYINQLDLGASIKAIESDKAGPSIFKKGGTNFEATAYGQEYLYLKDSLPTVGFVV
jgi:Protein of unknown function (DUF4054)